MAAELFSTRKGRIPRIDLMMARSEEQAKARQICRRNLAGIGAVCVMSSVVFVPLSLRALHLNGQIRKAQQTLLSASRQEEQNTPIGGDVDARLARWVRFTQSRAQRLMWRDALHALVAPVPAQAVVEHIQLEGKSDTITATLSGSSENISVVRDYVRSLEHDGRLRQPHLTGTSSDFTFGPEAAKFTVSAQAGKTTN